MATRKLTKKELNLIPIIEKLFESEKMIEIEHLNQYGMIDGSGIKKTLETNISNITILRLVNIPVFFISFTVFDDSITFAFDSKEVSEHIPNSFNDFMTTIEDIK